jgi:mannitol-specific phosphotransferase system IIBC component
MQPVFDNTSKAGTFTGAMVTIFANITNPDVFKTVLLAAIGAAVSFVVTQVLKMLVRRMRHFK